jgi:hypothetical protein
MTFAAIIATNLFEPASDYLMENADAAYTYVYDFLTITTIFAMSYAILRAITDGLSLHRIEFHPYVELGGRTFFSLWAGWLFLCFTVFALQTAPIESNPLGAWASPAENTFIMSSPDLQWARFAFDRSRGALGPGLVGPPEDHQPFDHEATFVARYHDRRARFEKMPGVSAGS